MKLTEILTAPGPTNLDDLGGSRDKALLSEFVRFGRLSQAEQAQVRVELAEYPWWLLGFAERMATLAVRRTSPEALVGGMVALSLYDQSSIDRRDAQVVAALCVRAGALLRLGRSELLTLVDQHTDETGRDWLSAYSPREPVSTPATHQEIGTGPTFAFARKPAESDLEELAKWADPRLR